MNQNHKRTQKFSFGKASRRDYIAVQLKEAMHKPGPGGYDGSFDVKRTSPRFGFGTSKRPDLGGKRDNIPGPGAYKVPVRLLDTPNYAQVKHDSIFKHV